MPALGRNGAAAEKTVGGSVPKSVEGRPVRRICIIGLGGGGFHREIQRVINLVSGPLEVVLVYSNPGGASFDWTSPHRIHTAHVVRAPALWGDRSVRTAFLAITNFFRALQILLWDEPDLILAVATAQALPFGLAARLLGKPLWFLESRTRVRSPSRTGRWMHRLRLFSRLFYFWPELAPFYRRGVYVRDFS